MGRWFALLVLPAALQGAQTEEGVSLFLDQTTPAPAAREAILSLRRAGCTPTLYVVVRNPATLDRDLLRWGADVLEGIRLADREALELLRRASPRLPATIRVRGRIAHACGGVPRDLKEFVRCDGR